MASRERLDPTQPVHVFLCVADHFEPMWNGASRATQRQRMDRWRRELPRMAAGIHDSDGRPPQHTFFYPQDQYDAGYLNELAELCGDGYGDVEVHLHHEDDNSAALRETLLGFTHALVDVHDLLRRDARGRPAYGFIHGDWALANSDPHGRYCGVNDELTILRETGCYADFTLPSAPSPTQTTTVNSIYYAIDDPDQPKSHDRGVAARVGQAPPADGLLLIQGPLSIDWSNRKWGLLPRFDYANIQGVQPATLQRLQRWRHVGVGVLGRPNWQFVKVHTHGCQEVNMDLLLGEPMRRFHEDLAEYARKTPGFHYHYVTAYEMANLVHQAERGAEVPSIGPACSARMADCAD